MNHISHMLLHSSLRISDPQPSTPEKFRCTSQSYWAC